MRFDYVLFFSFLLWFFIRVDLAHEFALADGAVGSDWMDFEHFIDAEDAVVMWFGLQIPAEWQGVGLTE